MAIDTQDKRASCLGHSFPARIVFPSPDSTINVFDRQQTAYIYAGINTSSVGANKIPWQILFNIPLGQGVG